MNARLYDPALGRFLSPDPYVQAPDFSQNYNRYSYCLNNPFKYTDPSGLRLSRAWSKFFLDIVLAVVLAVAVVAGTVAGAVLTGGNPYGIFAGFAVGFSAAVWIDTLISKSWDWPDK